MGSPIRAAGIDVDLASRIAISTTVAASPALAAETVVASVALPPGFRSTEQVLLDAWAAFTVGTSGTATRWRIRRTDINGTVVGDTGALTGGVAAAALIAQDVAAVDATSAGVYALTLQVTAGAAASTVSQVRFVAFTI
jgi:hypothetical protein